MRTTGLIVIVILPFSCQSEKAAQTQKEKDDAPAKKFTYNEKLKEHLTTIKDKKDTVFLGFVLGSSRAQVRNHLNKLIQQGKTSQKETISINMMNRSTKLSGYPFTLATGDSFIFKGLFDFKYLDAKLFSIDFQVYEGYHNVPARKLLTEKYGDEIVIGTWWKNNTEITISGGTKFGDIIYRDLSRRIELEADMKSRKEQSELNTIENSKQAI